MRKALILVLAAALCSLAFGVGSAQAKFANCHSWGCVNKKLNKLNKKAKREAREQNQIRRLALLTAEVVVCEEIVPVSQYGDAGGTFGYLFDNNDGAGEFFTTGLDFTADGDLVDEWMVVDGCVSKTGSKTTRPKVQLGDQLSLERTTAQLEGGPPLEH
jgi:hypothetical protein